MDGLDGQRPGDAPEHAHRRSGELLIAADDQHPARLRRQLDHAGDLLGRLEPRRVDRQGRAARLKNSINLPGEGGDPFFRNA